MGAPALDWASVPLAREADTRALPLPGAPAAVSMGNPHCIFVVEDAEAVEWPESPNRPGSAMNIISAAHRDTRAKLPRTAALKPLGLGPAGDELKPQEQVLGPAPCRSPSTRRPEPCTSCSCCYWNF